MGKARKGYIMNQVTLMGRLTKDPEIRMTTGEVKVARYTLAVDRPKKSGQENKADFISCIAWRGNADFAEKYLTKGSPIIVTGRIETGSYKNKDGNTVYTTEVNVSSHNFLLSQKGGQSDVNSDQATETPTDNFTSDGFMDAPEDDELPFN